MDPSIPDDPLLELSKDYFEEVVERLWSLGVVPALLPEAPIAYSRPVDSGRLAMVAYGIEVFSAERDQGTVAQRLIFNTRSDHEITGLPQITVEDYVVDYMDDTISCRKSVIHSHQRPDGTVYDFGKYMGPFIDFDDGDLKLTFGGDYEEDISRTFAADQADMVPGESLVEKLRLLHPGLRDDVASYQAYRRR